MSGYGSIVLTRHDDGGLTVDQADDIAGIDSGLFGDDSRPYLIDGYNVRINDDGHLVIAGQVTYKPIRFADNGRVIVCERVA